MLTGQWQRKFGRLNKYLSMLDYEGRPLLFHSHQLRDTFAVEHLLAGTSMQDLSKMLGHKTNASDGKILSPWVPERQAQLEEKMTEALKRMGATVSRAYSICQKNRQNNDLESRQCRPTEDREAACLLCHLERRGGFAEGVRISTDRYHPGYSGNADFPVRPGRFDCSA